MIAAAIAIGVLAGLVAGLLGVGGGILFVPALVVFLDLSQVDAEATSLLAIIPVAVVGVVRQLDYGNVRLKDGAIIGFLSAGGAFLGVALSNHVPERALRYGFAALTLLVAAQIVRQALREPTPRG